LQRCPGVTGFPDSTAGAERGRRRSEESYSEGGGESVCAGSCPRAPRATVKFMDLQLS